MGSGIRLLCQSGLSTETTGRMSVSLSVYPSISLPTQGIGRPGYGSCQVAGAPVGKPVPQESQRLSSSLMAGGVLSSSGEGQPFELVRPSTDWTRPTHPVANRQLHSVHRLPCASHPETPAQTHPESCLTKHLGSPGPARWTHKTDPCRHGYLLWGEGH